MNIPPDEKIIGLLIAVISDGFNRSLGALERSGAIDTKKLHTEYRGVRSKYYDLVTEQIELTAKYGALAFKQLFQEDENGD